MLALSLPIAAVLYISAEALSPKGTDQVATDTATALKLLAIAAKHPTQVYPSGTFAVLGRGALAVSYAAIAALARNRGSALAAAATAHTTRGAAAQFLVTTFNSGFGHGFRYVYFIAIYVAPLLMGIALWRSRSVPRWLAVLFFAGLEVAQQQISSGPVVILYMLPFAVAMVLLAARIWQAATLPSSQPQEEPASVPV